MITLPVIDETIKNKRVLVRGDIDVPVDDAMRLEAIWPTIEFLLEHENTVILCGHMGRPLNGFEEQFSTKRVAEWFAKKEVDSSWIDGRFHGFEINKNFIVLENLRFSPEEEKNDENFSKELSGLAEVYVNESFANCERAHASMVGVPKLLPHFAGFRLVKEIEVLGKIVENPRRPLLAIIGGAKIETKQPLIDKMKNFADFVVIGGKLATVEKDFIIDSLPVAQTIIWNGPFGAIEEEQWQAGTKKVVELILKNKKAYKVVGGGDTVAFLQKLGVLNQFDWVSTGGGSMLKFLAGEKLPGIEALL
ncbi:MAG: phosphoglycerate kinase [bacterium]|nr:phosphoglycerate kinase [bacterium]